MLNEEWKKNYKVLEEFLTGYSLHNSPGNRKYIINWAVWNYREMTEEKRRLFDRLGLPEKQEEFEELADKRNAELEGISRLSDYEKLKMGIYPYITGSRILPMRPNEVGALVATVEQADYYRCDLMLNNFIPAKELTGFIKERKKELLLKGRQAIMEYIGKHKKAEQITEKNLVLQNMLLGGGNSLVLIFMVDLRRS